MGLRITQILAEQIDGALMLDCSHGGTRFELTFLSVSPGQQQALDSTRGVARP
jgi:hypothetical protein